MMGMPRRNKFSWFWVLQARLCWWTIHLTFVGHFMNRLPRCPDSFVLFVSQPTLNIAATCATLLFPLMLLVRRWCKAFVPQVYQLFSYTTQEIHPPVLNGSLDFYANAHGISCSNVPCLGSFFFLKHFWRYQSELYFLFWIICMIWVLILYFFLPPKLLK